MKDDFYYNDLKNHVLDVVDRGAITQVFRLRNPETGNMMSTTLVFLPSVIIITGDLRVKSHGVQAIGYGLDWFKHKLEPDYLAEKFLETTWVPDHAKKYFSEVLEFWKNLLSTYEPCEEGEEFDEPELQKRDWRVAGEDLEDVTIIEALEKLIEDETGENFLSPESLYDALPAYRDNVPMPGSRVLRYHCPFDTSDGLGGYGYPDHEVGWLAAINRRFAELYKDG